MLDALPYIAALLAGVVAAISGFGIGSLVTPALLPSFSMADAVALVALPHAAASSFRLVSLRRDVDWKTFRQFGVASALGGLAGALLQTRLASSALTALLGALLLAAGCAEVARRPVPLPASPAWRWFGGLLSGAFGGLVGNQGGVRSAALLGFGLSPRALVATSTASAVIVDLARLPIYALVAGSTLSAHKVLIGGLTLSVLAGTLAGLPLLGRVPPPLYRRIVGLLLIALGAHLFMTALR